MSSPNQLLENNIIDPCSKPIPSVTDYHKENDDFIIEYAEIEHLRKVNEEDDTDFVVEKVVEEVSRTPRQAYIDSFANDVGILNIIEKVRMSGDATLLNQTKRVPMKVVGKDALGHDVEAVVDVSAYQVDQVAALESYKIGAKAFDSLDPDLKKKLNLEAVANLSDEEILAYVKGKAVALAPKQEEGENK